MNILFIDIILNIYIYIIEYIIYILYYIIYILYWIWFIYCIILYFIYHILYIIYYVLYYIIYIIYIRIYYIEYIIYILYYICHKPNSEPLFNQFSLLWNPDDWKSFIRLAPIPDTCGGETAVDEEVKWPIYPFPPLVAIIQQEQEITNLPCWSNRNYNRTSPTLLRTGLTTY